MNTDPTFIPVKPEAGQELPDADGIAPKPVAVSPAEAPPPPAQAAPVGPIRKMLPLEEMRELLTREFAALREALLPSPPTVSPPSPDGTRQHQELGRQIESLKHLIRDFDEQNATPMLKKLATLEGLSNVLNDSGGSLFRSAQTLEQDLRQLGLGVRGQVKQGMLREVVGIINKILTRKFTQVDEVQEALEEMLAVHGLTREMVNVGDPLDATRHRVIGTRPTTQREQDRTIAEVRGTSWTFADDRGGRLCSAEVIVYRYTEPAPEPQPRTE